MAQKKSKKIRNSNNRYKKRCAKAGTIFTPLNKEAIFERDNYRCYLCHKPIFIYLEPTHPNKATLDHIIPISKGGNHTEDNVRACCFSCNNSKGSNE